MIYASLIIALAVLPVLLSQSVGSVLRADGMGLSRSHCRLDGGGADRHPGARRIASPPCAADTGARFASEQTGRAVRSR